MTLAAELAERALAGAAPGAEVILRRDAQGVWLVTHRDANGAAPRVHALDQRGILTELDPALDKTLPGAVHLRRPTAWLRRLGEPRGSVTVVRWRPGSRAVLRVDRSTGPALFVKCLTKKAFARVAGWLPALPVRDVHLQLCRPVLLLAPECALVTEAAGGRSLHDCLRSGARVDLDLVRSVLAELATVRGTGNAPRGLDQERRSTLKQLEQGSWLLPSLGALHARIRDLDLAVQLASGTVHADLHDKQLFLAAGSGQLIDLEGMAPGDPQFDAVNLIEHCRLRTLQAADGGEGADFAAALTAALRLDAAPRTGLYRALVRARLAGVYALRPRWHALACRLGEEAEIALQGW